MSTSIINVKVDAATKKAVQEFAADLGVTVSSLLNAQLRQMLRDRRVTLSTELEPTPYLEKILREVEDDIKHDRNMSAPMSVEQILKRLGRL